MKNTRILSDDFIDEAQVRFARSTTRELARYIEAATIDAMVTRRPALRVAAHMNTRIIVDPTVPPGAVVIESDGKEVGRIVGLA